MRKVGIFLFHGCSHDRPSLVSALAVVLDNRKRLMPEPSGKLFSGCSILRHYVGATFAQPMSRLAADPCGPSSCGKPCACSFDRSRLAVSPIRLDQAVFGVHVRSALTRALADRTLQRAITTKLATIQPPPLPAMNGVAGSGFQLPGSRILDKTSRVSRLCAEIYERVNAIPSRPLEGAWPYLWLYATYLKVREGGRIISKAVIIAVADNEAGKREVLGVATGPSEAETFRTESPRSLADRGLRGVKLVIADDHKGLRAAARRVINATHQRCRIHCMRNALAHAPGYVYHFSAQPYPYLDLQWHLFRHRCNTTSLAAGCVPLRAKIVPPTGVRLSVQTGPAWIPTRKSPIRAASSSRRSDRNVATPSLVVRCRSIAARASVGAA